LEIIECVTFRLMSIQRPNGTSGKTFGRRDGHRSLVTPERVLSEYNEDLIFFWKIQRQH